MESDIKCKEEEGAGGGEEEKGGKKERRVKRQIKGFIRRSHTYLNCQNSEQVMH